MTLTTAQRKELEKAIRAVVQPRWSEFNKSWTVCYMESSSASVCCQSKADAVWYANLLRRGLILRILGPGKKGRKP